MACPRDDVAGTTITEAVAFRNYIEPSRRPATCMREIGSGEGARPAEMTPAMPPHPVLLKLRARAAALALGSGGRGASGGAVASGEEGHDRSARTEGAALRLPCTPRTPSATAGQVE